MRLPFVAVAAVAALLCAPAQAQEEDAALRRIIAASHRAPQNVARDQFRKPYEVLHFYGLRDTMTVVEIHPGGATAYWTEILGPYLKAKGKYIAGVGDEASEEGRRANPALRKKIADSPALYEGARIAPFNGGRGDFAPAGGADMVVTFRNIHNWMASGDIERVMTSFYRALKPGGILGVKDHRGRTDQPQDPLAKSGYVREDYMIELARKAGFEFAGRSDAVANPRDTKDHPPGVWALPPTYRLGDQDRAKYTAIGESDRFALKFVKPAR